nr:DUF935 family protein [Pseudomonas aeruginosa]
MDAVGVHHRPQSWFQLNPEDQNELRLRDNSPAGEALQPFGWIIHRRVRAPAMWPAAACFACWPGRTCFATTPPPTWRKCWKSMGCRSG